MKVLLTATVQSHICQFHRPLAEVLHEHGCEVHVAARNNLAEKNGLKLDFVEKVFDIPFSRSPKSPDNIKAYRELKKIINEGQYDVVHCNTPMGGIVTRLAARKARKKGTKVYYTAHGFHFYKGAPKKNWLIFYPIEKILAKYADTIITITKEDYKLAKSKGFKSNIRYIHGVGVNKEKYQSLTEEDIIVFRKEQGYEGRFVILCTGELNTNKNQKAVIRAVNEVSKIHPEVLLLLAGNGSEEYNLKNLITDLNMKQKVILLGYHTDLEKYTNACNIIVSASYREGLPLNIMEGMICGKSIIASLNRGHRELIEDGKTGFLVNADNINEFSNKITKLIEDTELSYSMGLRGKAFIEKFTMDSVEKELEKIYGF